MKKLIVRTLTGAAFVAALIGSMLYNHSSFGAMFMLVTLLAVNEFCTLIEQYKKTTFNKWLAIAGGGFLFIASFFAFHFEVGNPCVDAVDAFLKGSPATREEFLSANNIPDKPVVALLAGSRKQEITANLPLMLEAMKSYPEYRPIIAGAPGIDKEFYEPYLKEGASVVFGKTYDILNNSHAALVTSGTATLETALFNVPQVVCYATPMAKLYSWLKKHFLKVRFVSLVNLIAGKEVVRELVAADMTLANVKSELGKLLAPDSKERAAMLGEYSRMMEILGKPGASERAASKIVSLLQSKNSNKV